MQIPGQIFNLESITKKFAWAAVGGTVAGLLTYFSDQIHAYASSIFVGGNLHGEYVLQTYRYDDPKNEWVLWNAAMNLNHGGTQVFGTQKSLTTNQTWTVHGYFRSPFLSLAYENDDRAAVGTGTYTFRQDLPYVFWGHWIGVECNLNTNQRFLAQCPAIAYLKKYPAEQARYAKFMDRKCIEITLDAGPCPARKPSTVTPPKK